MASQQQSEIVEGFAAPVASLAIFQAEACGTTATNAALAPDREGLKILSHDAANSVYGLEAKTASLLAATNYLKSGDQPWIAAKIKTPAALTAIEYLLGLLNATLDGAHVSGKDYPGEYNNSALTHGVYFWYDQATDSGKLCIGYKWTGVDVDKVVLDITLAVDVQYDLQISVDANRKLHFAVDGVEVYVSSEVMPDALALLPFLYVIGNAKTLYVRELSVGKNYS